MHQPNLVAIVGSLRKDSYNRRLALLAKEAVGGRAGFELLDYADLPMMNEDIEFPPPEPVRRVREVIRSADGVWFFTPEYNHYFPGVLKNLIDWLSRPAGPGESQVLSQKPAAFSGITPGMSGTGIAQDHLVTLISLLNMRVMNWPRVTIPNAWQQLDEEKELRLSAQSAGFLEKQANAFLTFVQKG